MNSIDKYIELLEIKEEFAQLNEADFSQYISKLTPERKTKSLVKKLNSSIDKKNPGKTLKVIKSLLSFLPTLSPKKIDSFIKPKFSEYVQFKKLADTILKNSIPETSDNMRDYASSFLALSSIIVEKNKPNTQPRENLKNRVKEFVIKTRRFMEDNEPEEEEEKPKKVGLKKEDLPDLAVAWVIIVMATGMMTGIGTGIYLIFSAIASHVTVIFFILLAIAFITAVAKTVPVIVGSMGGM